MECPSRAFTTAIGIQAAGTIRGEFYALRIGKLGTVIHGNGPKHAIRELTDELIQGIHRGFCGLVRRMDDDLIAGETLGQDKKRLPLAFVLADHAIHFPMTKGIPVRDTSGP